MVPLMRTVWQRAAGWSLDLLGPSNIAAMGACQPSGVLDAVLNVLFAFGLCWYSFDRLRRLRPLLLMLLVILGMPILLLRGLHHLAGHASDVGPAEGQRAAAAVL